ncbi:MAG TPA: hypothetical protein VGQ38_07015 [Gaiellaceae bacterium]|jgi:hypothetical protein|nr:hypothetical protein [Gaiellaceae bacterium]
MRPIACTLDDGDRAKRIERWHALGPVVEETQDGLRITSDNVTELRELALLEQDCCAFASWNVVLEVRADSPEGVAALHAMF